MDRASWLLGVVVASVASACVHRGTGGGSAGFSVSYPDATVMSTPARIGKRFYAKPAGQCHHADGGDARWAIGGARVASGELPPGLTIEDGVIGGVPKTAGTFKATIELSGVTCATTSYPDQTVDVLITVK